MWNFQGWNKLTGFGHQPLWMAAHVSDWGDSLNQCQMSHHGDDVCGGSCVDAWRDSRTLLTIGNLQSRSFSFLPPKKCYHPNFSEPK
jgi:hypothetical protein